MSKKVLIERNGSGGVVSTVAIGDGLEFHGEWMSHGYVTVTVNSATEIAFAVGDFVEFAGRKFYLWDEESVKKQARSGSYGEAYVYDNIKLHEGTVALEQVSMHDVVLEDNGQTYSSLSRFSFFGATVDDLADRIQANLVRQSTAIGGDTLRFRLFTPDKTRTTGRMSNMGNVGTAWESYYTGNEATGKKDVAVSIQNETLWGALGHAYNDFELPYYVTSSNENDVDYIDIVIGGKAVEVSNSAFVYGKGHGLYEIERSADSDQRIVTKLFAYGSTENLPTNYYGNLYKIAYADCLQSDTFVIDGGNYYFVDAVTGSGILWSSVKDALGVRADVRPSPFSIGGHTPVGKSVTVRCNNTNYTASIWVYETGGEQYLSFKTETQTPVVSDTKFYIPDGVDLLKWPNSKIETASGYPGGMAIVNLMLPGFPKVSLADWVDALPAGNATKVRATNYVLSDEETDPWIQSANAAVYGIREGEVYFDGTDDRENIRPSIENTDFGTVASVTGITDDGWVDKTEGFVIKVLAANGGGDFWQAVWDAPHDDEVPLTMTSGYHNGREFKLTKVVVGTTYVELSVDRIQDESGRWVPNTEQPIVGSDLPTPQHDAFVVTGIQLPKEYIDAASEKLLMAAFDELDKIDHGLRTYQPRLDEIYMANEQATAEIESRASLHDTLRAGMVLKWQWEDYGTQGATVISSTIDVLTIKEDGNNGVPTYDVVLRDEKEKSLTEKIATVVSKTAGIGGGTAVRSDGGNADTAKKADRLSGDDEVTAWGQTYWQDGRPKDVSGSLEGVDDITMTGDLNLGNTGMGIDQSGDAVLGDIGADKVTVSETVEGETIETIIEPDKVTTPEIETPMVGTEVFDGALIGGSGWRIWLEESGASHMVVDQLEVRLKAYFAELEIRKVSYAGGNLIFSAAASRIDKVIPVTRSGGVAAEGDTVVGYKCFFKTDDGTTATSNGWVVGDQALCRTFNIDAGKHSEVSNRYYWRKVIAVGDVNASEEDEGEKRSYFVLAANETGNYMGTAYTNGIETGVVDIPAVGDSVVLLGHQKQNSETAIEAAARQNAITIEANSTTAPAIYKYQGIDDFTLDGKMVQADFYDSNTKKYKSVTYGDWFVGANTKISNNQRVPVSDPFTDTPETFVRYRQNVNGSPLLEIKAKIDASSPYGETSETIGDMFTNLNDGLNNAEDEIDDLDYLKTALNEITTVEGGLILTNLIQLRQNNTVWAGISGQYSKHIAAWFGGLMKDYESLTDAEKADGWSNQRWAKSLFRFDGSGYLAGGNISWENDGDTTVQGTIKADNFFRTLAIASKGENTLVINPDGVATMWLYAKNDFVDENTRKAYVGGEYYEMGLEEFFSLYSSGDFAEYFSACTGPADEVVVSTVSYTPYEGNGYIVKLPKSQDYEGKVITINNVITNSPVTVSQCDESITGFSTTGISLVRDDTTKEIKIAESSHMGSSINIGAGEIATFYSVGDYWIKISTINSGVNTGDVTQQWVIDYVTDNAITISTLAQYATQLWVSEQGYLDSVAFSDLTTHPSTLSGYGIVDAKIENGEITLGNQTITPLTQHQSLADYLTRQEALDTFVLTSALVNYVTIDGEQTISGLKTFGSNVQLGAGTAVKAYDKGTDLLAYKSGTWGGVTGEHWFVGAAGVNGFIRSAGELKRWANNSDQYTIWDASNFTPSAWKVKDVQVVADNGLVLNGEEVIYDVVLASNGMLTLKSTRLSIAVPENTSDLVNDSGFIDQTGGVVDGLTVTNDLDAGLITVGSLVNSNTLAEYLDADAMQTWLQQQGYITQTTADGRYIKGVSVYGSSLNPDANRVVNIPYADINTPGVIQIGTGLVNDNEGHTTVDTTVIASRQWANKQFVTLLGEQTISGAKKFTSDIHLGSGAVTPTNIMPRIYWGDSTNVWIWEDTDNHLMIHASEGVNFEGRVRFNLKPRVLTDSENNTYTSVALTSDLSGYATSSWVEQNWLIKDMMESIPTSPPVDGRTYIDACDLSLSGSTLMCTHIRVKDTFLKADITDFAHRHDTSDINGISNYALSTDVSQLRSDVGSVVTGIGVDGDTIYCTYNDVDPHQAVAFEPVTVPYATRTMGFKRLNVTGSQIADANTMTVDNVEYALLSNYASTNLWSNMPSGMSYGSVLQLTSQTSLDGQLAWDSNHGVTTGVTRKLYWRSRNDSGWGTNDWHTIAFEDWVTTQLNTLGDNLQTYVNTQLGGYLPLTAGSNKPLTGNIAYKGTKATYDMITFIDNKSDQWGNGIAIGGGGATIIGGGESAVTMIGQLPKVTVDGVENINGGSEVMYIGNDTFVSIFTNLGTASGWANRKEFFFDTGGSLSVPSNVVSKAPNNSAFRLQGANYDIALHLGSGGTNRGIYEFSPKGNWLLYFDASNTILNHGNVGIGTTNPQANLDVNGSVKIAGSLTGVTTISTSSGIFAGGNIETKGSFVWCDSQNFSLTIMEGLAVSGDVNYCCALFRHKPQVQLGSDMLEVVVAKSDENGIEFRGSEDGTYTFGYGNGRGDIYAGAGDFTGAIETTSYNFRGTADAYGHGGASISHKSSSSVEGLEYYAGRSGQHYFKAYNSNGNEVYANIHCLTCDETSDIRQKEVVEYLNPSVYDIANAPIIKFRWIDGGNDLHLGSISQYWEKTLPETVHIGDDLMQSMEKSTIALLAGITAARKSVDNERRIAELEQRVAELEDELAAMVSQHSETTDN